MIFRALITFFFFSISYVAIAVNELTPVYSEQATDNIEIDGVLKESAWRGASTINDLVEVYPDDSGLKPELETEIKVLYTEKGLFIGFWCETPKEKQMGRLSFRDNGGVERDWFRVSIDPSGQGVNGYYMELALGGSIQDGTIVGERRRIREWDGPWRGTTASDESGWSGEMFLPWSMFALPESQTNDRLMGIHFERWVSHLSERWSWEPLSERDSKYLSGFSRLHIRNLNTKSSLTLYPYAAGSSDQLNSNQEGKGGFDLFWNPASGMRLAATALPDFGQVESDAVVVNLSAFETFFPEKRPFFLEDRDIYNTRRLNLVHTRRIGANSDLEELSDEYSREGADGASDILAASKFSGQQGNFRYGAMFAIEDNNQYTVVHNETGERTDAKSDGRQYYTARFMHEKVTSKGAYHSIGWLGTLTNRPVLDRDAQVNAIDGIYRSREGKWNLNWQALNSHIQEVDEKEDGFGGWAELTWRPKKGWKHFAELYYSDDTLNINDMGFLRRNNERKVSYVLERNNTELSHLRGRESTAKIWVYQNNEGLDLGSGILGRRHWKLHNRTAFFLRGHIKPDHWDDRLSRDNGNVKINGRKEASLGWDSNPRNRVGLFLEAKAWTGSYNNSISYQGLVFGRLTVNDHLDFRLSTNWRQEKDMLLWREDKTFAIYNSGRLSPTLRANMLFSTKQDMRVVVQWYAIKAETREVLTLQSTGDLTPVSNADTSVHDFAIGSLAIQARYRYEIGPLSDFFAVYSRGGYYDDSQASGLSSIWSGSLSNKTADQFLVKLRYRFG